jgi:cytochrome c oxidase assembly protein subunit 15
MEIILKKEYSKIINFWLLSLLFFIGVIVVVGGLTRLTDSGLSITTWDVVKGILPPLNNNQWENMFNLYKEIPQFYLLNQNMTLGEFKIIYYWEYIHRLLGRILGLMFLIPFIFIYYKKILHNKYNFNFLILFLLILLQGTVGWYMVKSGLIENTTVSHYRLAVHLNLAFILFASIFWYFLNINSKKNKIFFNFNTKYLSVKIFIFLVFLQITFGAFTSGLDAGKVYQTWPLMNNYFFPDDLTSNVVVVSQIFNEPSFVQFIHRNLAYLILFYVLVMTFIIFYKKDKSMYNSSYFLLTMIFVQILLGIFTLLSGAYIWIASLHQISTILLLISSIYFYYNSLKS